MKHACCYSGIGWIYYSESSYVLMCHLFQIRWDENHREFSFGKYSICTHKVVFYFSQWSSLYYGVVCPFLWEMNWQGSQRMPETTVSVKPHNLNTSFFSVDNQWYNFN